MHGAGERQRLFDCYLHWITPITYTFETGKPILDKGFLFVAPQRGFSARNE